MRTNSFEKESEAIRRDFPLISTDNSVYLDSAATSQKPSSVLEAVKSYYERDNANPLRGLYDLSVRATESYEGARESVRKFINAESTQEIIFTRNASESMNLVAYSYMREFVGADDEVIVSISEHHSNFLPWVLGAKAVGAKLKFLECDKSGRYTPQMLEEIISDKTRLVAIAQVSNVIGRENPVKEFAEIAHKHGAVLVCDGAQSVPHMPVDVQALRVDFLAFSGHKMLAPMGIGVLYGKKELLQKMPPFMSGGEMIEYVTREGATYAELPHKFEAGTVNAGGAAGLKAAIDYINNIGFEKITEREDYLTELAFSKMTELSHIHIIGSDDPKEHHGILTFTIDDVHPHDIAAVFDADKIDIRAGHHCAQPLHKHLGVPSTVRASIAFYNNEDDIERFISSLKTIRRRMGYAE